MGQSDLKDTINVAATALMGKAGLSERQMAAMKQAGWWWLVARQQAIERRSGVVPAQAVVWTRHGPADLVRVDVPLAGPGEVTVSVTSTVVSPGTERAWYMGLPNAPATRPFRPGYSGAGVVLAVGPGVDGIAVGDRVAGQFQHQSTVTLPASSVVRVPAGVSLSDAAWVHLGVISGYGMSRAAVRTGETLAVLGLGPIGLLALRIGIAQGAANPVAVASSSRRATLAHASGAQLVTVHDEAAVSGLDAAIVVEATGDSSAIGPAVQACAARGRILLLGSPRGLTSDLPLAVIQRKGCRLIGAHVSALDLESQHAHTPTWSDLATEFLGHVDAGRVPVADLCTEVIDPRGASAFYHRLAVNDAPFGARFDWSDGHHRLSPLRLAGWFVTPPSLDVRGLDADRRPRRAAIRARSPKVGSRGSVRFGLVGCGEIAVATAQGIAATTNASVTRCYDPSPGLAEDLAAQHGALPARSMDELLASSDVDAVVVSVPHHLHAPLSIAAMRAGKHVVTEKPPASSLRDAVAMTRVADEAGVAFSVLLPMRYEPRMATARRLIADGALGAVTGGFVAGWLDKPPTYLTSGFSGRTTSDWRSSRDKAGGGVLIMNASHDIDIVRYLSGLDVEEVVATMAALDAPAEVEDSVAVVLRMSNGAIITLDAGGAVRGANVHDVRLWGTAGNLVVEPEMRLFTRRPLRRLATSRWQAVPADRGPSPRSLFVASFASSVAEGRVPDVGPEDALALQAAVEAIYRSAETRRAVRPADVLADAMAADATARTSELEMAR